MQNNVTRKGQIHCLLYIKIKPSFTNFLEKEITCVTEKNKSLRSEAIFEIVFFFSEIVLT